MKSEVVSEPIARLAHQLMKQVLPLKNQRFIDGGQIRQIARKFNIHDIEQEIYFLRETQTIIRKLPLKIFKEDDDRIRLVTAFQEALDEAVDAEEEEYELD